MNTKIGTSFGLALLMVIAVVTTMFAMGMLTPKPTSAAGLGGIDVAITPATAYSNGQYTILVSGTAAGTGLTAIPVGGTITVTFGSKYTVPSTIATSAIKLKATVVSGGTAQNAGYLNDPSVVNVVGRAVTMTVPDMDTNSSGNGDQAIAAHGDAGVGSAITITFTQAAGILNPKLAQDANNGSTGTLTVKTSTDTTAVTAATTTAITSFSKFSPTTGKRAAEIAITGGGFTASCDDCKIRLSPQSGTAPTTGAGGVAYNGSGAIDANGAFVGTITLNAGTKVGGYVWITDSIGISQVSSTAFVQLPSAVPASTSSKPGSTVSVTLTDYPAASDFTTDADLSAGAATLLKSDDHVTIGGTAAVNTALTFTATQTATAALTKFKFVVPASIGVGTHKVIISPTGTTKTANFMLTISLREVTVTPATAAPGQAITISGTGFTKSGEIPISGLTMKAGSVATTANVNAAAISIDTLGAFNYATTMPTLNATSCSGCSATIVFTASDNATIPLVGVSDTSFSRTLRTVELSPTTISPGGALTVTAKGFAVDTSTTGATMTVSVGTTTTGGAVTLVGTYIFPLGADGEGVGTVTLPTTVGAGTLYVTVTDNAGTIHETASLVTSGQGINTANNSKQVSITVPKGILTISPLAASTGELVTLVGENFPPNTTATTLTVGTATAMPAAGILTDAVGGFTATVEVPAATAGGSLSPGTHIVTAVVGQITGTTTDFSAPNPVVTVSPASASVEESITISGVGFNSLGTVSTLTIGSASALPSPAPRATRSGGLEFDVTVPLLNPGTYTVTMTNATGFSASTTFVAVAATVVAASTADDTATIFADVIANDDNLVRVWRFSNPDQSWSFYDPRPAFADANTLAKTGAGDIVWVNVTAEQTVADLTDTQNGVLSAGWNLISLK